MNQFGTNNFKSRLIKKYKIQKADYFKKVILSTFKKEVLNLILPLPCNFRSSTSINLSFHFYKMGDTNFMQLF